MEAESNIPIKNEIQHLCRLCMAEITDTYIDVFQEKVLNLTATNTRGTVAKAVEEFISITVR